MPAAWLISPPTWSTPPVSCKQRARRSRPVRRFCAMRRWLLLESSASGCRRQTRSSAPSAIPECQNGRAASVTRARPRRLTSGVTVSAAVRWPCRPSTRSRVKPSERGARSEGTGLSMAGTLYGVGLGPGDPELVTVKAVRLIAAADVVAYHSARHGRSVARLIAEPYLRGDQIEEQLVYPVTTETIDHPGGYERAIEEFYEQAAARLMAHLEAGRDVVLLAEGDPLFYSSYMHMHKRIDGRYATQIVPGVTSVSAACAALGMPLTEGDDVLTVLPGTMAQEQLSERLMTTDAAAIMKISRSYAEVQQALKEAGRLEQAYYVERASGDKQVTRPAGAVDPSDVPYMSIVIVPGRAAAQGRPPAPGATTEGVIGVGRVD